jgi:lipooligosaccharide transport system ATP-binding protein
VSALVLTGVVKSFGDLRAVDGLDLDVPAGICMGLLGPNGAGKSTTMRMVTGQILADEGRIEVLGHPVPRQSKQARAAMGVVPQQDNLDGELTVRQNLEVFATLYRITGVERHAAVDRALRLAMLTDRAGTRAENLSGGMKRRLLIARGLVHSPRLVLLDEPTVGLDPQVRSELWVLIDDLRSAGVTILMSTHYIEEAQRLSDDVAMMSRGRVVARGTPGDLMRAHVGMLAWEYYGPAARLDEVSRFAEEAGLPARRSGPSVSVLRAETVPVSLHERLGDPGSIRDTTLEDVFVLLTGETVE